MNAPDALQLTLELTRGTSAGVDEGHLLQSAEYTRTREGGKPLSAKFPWSGEVEAWLGEVWKPGARPEVVQRVGNVLRTFLDQLGWSEEEGRLEEALRSGREVRLCLRSNASELCRLPLELVARDGTGQALGRTPGCHVQWEYPGVPTAPEEPDPPPEGGVLLVASAGVNSAEHVRGVREACRKHGHPEKWVEHVPDVSLRSLGAKLDEVRARKQAVAVLHLVCHGRRLEGAAGGYGLKLASSRDEAAEELVDPLALAAKLEGYRGLVRSVVLCVCQSGTHDDQGVLGSVAQRLHRVGIASVVAFRCLIRPESAESFSAAFYGALLAGEPLHRAVGAGRAKLGEDAGSQEWAAVQLHARQEDGAQFPVVFRPYRGLQTFEKEHRRFFFGREKLTRTLLERVLEAAEDRRPRFQMVVGTSGSGKSSLVMAGLVPALPEGWEVVTIRPSGEGHGEQKGLDLLATVLCRKRGGWRGQEPASDVEVKQEARQLHAALSGRRVLLVVDQLEEAFQLGSQTTDFARCLWELARDETLGLVVLSTFRDVQERAQEVVLEPGVSLQDVVYGEEHRLFVPLMDAQGLLDAIQKPLEAAGLKLDDPGVAERLRTEAGVEPGALPLLEHALDSLWEARTGGRLSGAVYETLGGLSGALTKRLDRLWGALDAAQQRQGRRLLVALVDIAKDVTLSTRRREQVKELRPSGTARAAAFDAVLERLVEYRLLVRGGEHAQGEAAGWVEIAHEALIRKWPRLQEWIKAEQQRAQRREVRKARMTAGGALVALLIVAVLGGVAYTQAQRARSAISQALEVANEVVFTVDRELEPLSGAGPIRRKLLERVGALQQKLQSASNDVESARLRAATHVQRGGIALSHDDLKKARAEHEAAVAIFEKLAKEDPSNAGLQRDLFVSYEKLAEVAQAGGDLQAARELFSKALAIAEKLAKEDPSNAGLQRDLSVSYNKLADVAKAGGAPAARELFSKALAIREKLAKEDPSNASLQRDLSLSYERLAVLDMATPAQAREWFGKALRLRQRLAERDADNVEVQLELARCEMLSAAIEHQTGDRSAARLHRNAAAELVDRLIREGHSAHPAIKQLKNSLASFQP